MLFGIVDDLLGTSSTSALSRAWYGAEVAEGWAACLGRLQCSTAHYSPSPFVSEWEQIRSHLTSVLLSETVCYLLG